jgi:hypothetical protein
MGAEFSALILLRQAVIKNIPIYHFPCDPSSFRRRDGDEGKLNVRERSPICEHATCKIQPSA